MAVMESIEVPLGAKMPSFSLKDPEGREHNSARLMGRKGLLVVFTCNHCPYARAVWPRLILLAQAAKALGINTVAVNPNIHPDYPEDAPKAMRENIREWGVPFPYLVDQEQLVARAYRAQCTPDPYLLDSGGRLVYHGRFDDNWKDEAKVTRRELRDAITAVAFGRPVAREQSPSMGCSIKWR